MVVLAADYADYKVYIEALERWLRPGTSVGHDHERMGRAAADYLYGDGSSRVR